MTERMLLSSPIAYARRELGWMASDTRILCTCARCGASSHIICFILISPVTGSRVYLQALYSLASDLVSRFISDLCFSQFTTRVCPLTEQSFAKLSELPLACLFLLVHAHSGRQVSPDVEASLKNKPWRRVSGPSQGYLERPRSLSLQDGSFHPCSNLFLYNVYFCRIRIVLP